MSHSTEIIEAADLAVKKVFYLLGVDVDKPESVDEFRQDLRFAGKIRKLADNGVVGVIGFLVLGLMTALWSGIVHSIRK